jgi:MerR family transcriptional regulator, light-induced transcriptional regulator
MATVPGEEPLFNIGAVTRVTGVPVATLRVWEQRYGFPRSARTPGGHRLYSRRDIERIQWIKERQDGGMKTGQAIRALQRLEEGAPLPPGQPAISQVDSSRPALDLLCRRLLATLSAHDLDAAGRMMGDMLAFYSPEELALGVMLPVLSSIGTEWAEGRMSVATEHLASAFLRQRLLMWLVTGPPEHPVRPVVLACAPGEWHEGSLLMLGVLLRRRGWPVAYLGQALPLPDLAAFVREAGPSVVVLAAMTEETAEALLEWPRHLPQAFSTGSPVVGYGGAIYAQEPSWREKMPGLFLGATLEEGLATVEALLRR